MFPFTYSLIFLLIVLPPMEEIWRPGGRLDPGLDGPGRGWADSTTLSSFGRIAASSSCQERLLRRRGHPLGGEGGEPRKFLKKERKKERKKKQS